MAEVKRIFNNGAVEHRADSEWLGADAYTEENVPEQLKGLTWKTQDIEVNPLPDPPSQPDPNGFIEAALLSLGADRADALIRQYPTFLWSLERRNWSVARGRLDKGLADGTLSQGEYDGLKDLMDQYNIPSVVI